MDKSAEFWIYEYDRHAPNGMSKGNYFNITIKLTKQIEIRMPKTNFDPSASRVEENMIVKITDGLIISPSYLQEIKACALPLSTYGRGGHTSQGSSHSGDSKQFHILRWHARTSDFPNM
ncbi:nodulation ABC transporter NodI, partial [Striga asiatica]